MAANIQSLMAQMRQPDRGGGMTRPFMPTLPKGQSGGLPRAVAQGRLPMRKTGVPSPKRALRGGAVGGAMGAAAQPSGPREAMPPQAMPPQMEQAAPARRPEVPPEALQAVGMAGASEGQDDAQVNFLTKVIEAMMKASSRQGKDVADIFGMLGARRVAMRGNNKKKKK